MAHRLAPAHLKEGDICKLNATHTGNVLNSVTLLGANSTDMTAKARLGISLNIGQDHKGVSAKVLQKEFQRPAS